MAVTKKPQIEDLTALDPKEADKLTRSVLSRDEAPTVSGLTPDFNTWQRNRDVLGPPFDDERITVAQMRQIRKEPMIAFGLHYRKVPIARAEWHINARDKNGKNPQVAAFVDAAIRRIWARFVFQRMLVYDFGFQAMVKRFVLANPGGVYLDPLDTNADISKRVKPVWDNGSIAPKIYKVPSALRPEAVQPRFDDNTGEFDGITYTAPTQTAAASAKSKKRKASAVTEYDVYHSLWATHQKDEEHGSLYGYPLTGYAREYWWDYRYYRGLRRRAYERFAIPPVLAFHPEGSTVVDDIGTTRPNWEIAIEMAERMRGNAVAAVPSTMAEAGIGETSGTQRAWDFKFMDTPTDALSVFDNVFNYLNVMKLRSIWVPEMAFIGKESGNSGGNIAAQMQDIFNASMSLSMNEVMAEVNQYMIPHLLILNFPEFVNAGGTAEMVSTGFRAEDVEMLKQVLQLVGQANSAELMAQLDLPELLRRMNLPIKDPDAYAAEQSEIQRNTAAQGVGLVPGVTIANPGANAGALNGGSQPAPQPAGAAAAVGFEDLGGDFIYFAPMGTIDMSVELAELDTFLAGLPSSKHYSDKNLRALSVQLRRLWAAHFNRIYRDLASYVKKLDKFEFEDDDVMLSYGVDGMMFADPKKVAAAIGVTFITKKQAEKASKQIVDGFKLSSKVLKDLADKSAVIMRKMLKRGVTLDLKDANLKAELSDDAFDAFLLEQTGRLIKFTHGTLKNEIRDFLVNQIRDGKTSDEIADNLTSHFGSGTFSASKADRVARSETRDAVNAATLIAGEATGVKYVKAHDGEEFDEECRKRNGKLFTVREAWREMRKEHPYGTLAYELVPRVNLSVEMVNELPEERADNFAYFDDTTDTAYVLSTLSDQAINTYLYSLGDWLCTPASRNGTKVV